VPTLCVVAPFGGIPSVRSKRRRASNSPFPRGAWERANRASRTALGRLPTDDELAAGVDLVLKEGLDSTCWALLNASEFLYVR
jgi:hypothetical protein